MKELNEGKTIKSMILVIYLQCYIFYNITIEVVIKYISGTYFNTFSTQ